MTGFYRDGYCRVGAEDGGNHAVAGMFSFSSRFPLFIRFPRLIEVNHLFTPIPGYRRPHARVPRLLGLAGQQSSQHRARTRL